jgi:hypothetical protein
MSTSSKNKEFQFLLQAPYTIVPSEPVHAMKAYGEMEV